MTDFSVQQYQNRANKKQITMNKRARLSHSRPLCSRKTHGISEGNARKLKTRLIDSLY